MLERDDKIAFKWPKEDGLSVPVFFKKKNTTNLTIRNFEPGMVVVKWSVRSPSIPTIRVQIPLKSTIFLL